MQVIQLSLLTLLRLRSAKNKAKKFCFLRLPERFLFVTKQKGKLMTLKNLKSHLKDISLAVFIFAMTSTDLFDRALDFTISSLK